MIIFYNFRCELTQQQCIDELSSSRTSVYRWYGKFNRGRNSLQDQFREGRPKLVVVPEAIDTVRQLILQDRRVTYREIATTLVAFDCQKNFFALDPTQIVNRSKKGLCRLIERNAPNIRSRCFETRL